MVRKQTKPDPKPPVEAASTSETNSLTRPPSEAELKDASEKGKELVEHLKKRSSEKLVSMALSNPFPAHEVKWKPQLVKDRRALAIAYIDARAVMDRLDDVVGLDGWEDQFECLPGGSVVCTLRIKIGSEWVSRSDVGSQSEQPDEGDRVKAAFSDALKRAAIKFGIGRYLYRLPAQWVDYDPVKKQLMQVPKLPQSALPRRGESAAAPYRDDDDDPKVEAASTKPAPPTEKDQTEALVREWRIKISACENPDDLNAMLPGARSVPEFAKSAIWDMICETVKTDPLYWVYNRNTLKFAYGPKSKKPTTPGDFF